MDRDAAMADLPELYSRALGLRRTGAEAAAIAAALDLELEAVGPLLRVAEAKLARLQAVPVPLSSRPPSPPRSR
ncbi:MAG: hypothetical protein ACYC91_02215 [Solirubrobacteraceae bacterium]